MRVADETADEGCRERVLEREVEVRGQNEDEQRDAEAEPEEVRVEEAEHPQALRHGLDSPTRLFHDSLRWS